MYDYLIVGSGLSGATFAYEAQKIGKSVLVIDKRPHLGGNIYTNNQEGINVHMYGPHLFNTNNKNVWEYVKQFAEFNKYQHKVKVCYKNEMYHFPITLNTFHQLWGCKTPQEAQKKLDSERIDIKNPSNLEEWVLSQVGKQIYDIFINGFTEKQWGRPCSQLPTSIIKRIPIRFNWDDHYHNSQYCGIPVGGYSQITEKMLDKVELKLNTSFERDWRKYARKLFFTGPIDEFFDYKHGHLEYRSLRFENQILNNSDFQGIGQINYTDKDIPYTRIVEHKHFEFGKQEKTILTKEFPEEWSPGKNQYYPINDEKNTKIYNLYKNELNELDDVLGSGRLWCYKYLDMDDVLAMSLKCSHKELF